MKDGSERFLVDEDVLLFEKQARKAMQELSGLLVEVRGDQVKLGIDAPRNVKVFRQEVFDAIQEENKKAAAASGAQLPLIDIPPRSKEK